MAKSALDLKGAKACNMKLDVELLGRAIQTLVADAGVEARDVVVAVGQRAWAAACSAVR